MKIITLLLATWLLYSAFSPKPAGEKVKELITKATIITDTVKPPLTGADRDMHGCIGSAGYTWSIIKKELRNWGFFINKPRFCSEIVEEILNP